MKLTRTLTIAVAILLIAALSAFAGEDTKDAPKEELLKAIRTISTGRKYITPSVAEKLAETFDENFSGVPHSRLSDREFEVMCLIARGKSVKDIAEIKSISIHTVNT